MSGKRAAVIYILAGCAGFLDRPANRASAAEIIFSVDPSQSVLTASGTFNGAPIGPQVLDFISEGLTSPGIFLTSSMITSYAGTIVANCDAKTNTIQIIGGNVSALNTLDTGSVIPALEPPVDGSLDGPFTADYAFYQSSNELPSGTYYGAMRNFSFSLSSPIIASPNSFSTSQLSAAIVSGEVDSSNSATFSVGLTALCFCPHLHHPLLAEASSLLREARLLLTSKTSKL
jgi:hypothetical protein